MFCRYCGNSIHENDQFCSHCGGAQQEQSVANQSAPPVEQPAVNQPATEQAPVETPVAEKQQSAVQPVEPQPFVEVPVVQQPPVNQQSQPQPQPKPKKKSYGKIIAIVVAIVVVLGLLIALVVGGLAIVLNLPTSWNLERKLAGEEFWSEFEVTTDSGYSKGRKYTVREECVWFVDENLYKTYVYKCNEYSHDYLYIDSYKEYVEEFPGAYMEEISGYGYDNVDSWEILSDKTLRFAYDGYSSDSRYFSWSEYVSEDTWYYSFGKLRIGNTYYTKKCPVELPYSHERDVEETEDYVDY